MATIGVESKVQALLTKIQEFTQETSCTYAKRPSWNVITGPNYSTIQMSCFKTLDVLRIDNQGIVYDLKTQQSMSIDNMDEIMSAVERELSSLGFYPDYIRRRPQIIRDIERDLVTPLAEQKMTVHSNMIDYLVIGVATISSALVQLRVNYSMVWIEEYGTKDSSKSKAICKYDDPNRVALIMEAIKTHPKMIRMMTQQNRVDEFSQLERDTANLQAPIVAQIDGIHSTVDTQVQAVADNLRAQLLGNFKVQLDALEARRSAIKDQIVSCPWCKSEVKRSDLSDHAVRLHRSLVDPVIK